MLTDTAGLRDSADEVERLGIERTRRAINDADLVVVVIDGSEPLTWEDREVLSASAESRYVIAHNKNDLDTFNLGHLSGLPHGGRVVSVSARTGSGLDALSAAILEPFAASDTLDTGFLVTNARHYDLLRRASDSIRASEVLLEQRVSEELLLVGLYDALRFLGQITGETTPEDVLSQIFATFCIGK